MQPSTRNKRKQPVHAHPHMSPLALKASGRPPLRVYATYLRDCSALIEAVYAYCYLRMVQAAQSADLGTPYTTTATQETHMAQHGRFTHADDGSHFVKAMYSYSGAESASLSFQKGDFIEVITQLESGWWDGMIVPNRERGWFPSNYVIPATEAESTRAREQLAADEEIQLQQHAYDHREPRSRSETAKPNQSRSVDALLTFDALGRDEDSTTSFSTGADILSEIAGAAAGRSYGEIHDVPLDMSRNPSRAASDSSSTAEDWVPRVLGGGQIVFYNARTGQTSRDLPQDLSMTDYRSARGSSSEGTSASPSSTTDAQSLDERRRAFDVPTTANIVRGTELTLDVESLRVDAKMGSHGTLSQPPRFERRDSAYSDDSALDAVMQSSGKRAQIANKTVPFMPEPLSSRDASSASTATTLPRHPLAVLGPAAPASLSSLERKANDSISELIEEAHPRRKPTLSERSEEEQEMTRQRLFALTTTVTEDVRNLMFSADVFESSYGIEASQPIVGSVMGPSSGVDLPLAAYKSEIKPFVRKVTSTLSKLVLSMRAVWGQMGVSAPEESAYLASFADNPEVDMASLRAHRDDTLKIRADIETKLRWDIVDGAREVADAVMKFIDEAERLLSSPLTNSTLTPRIDRSSLPAVKRTTAVLHLQAGATVPGAGHSGNWRGNGFAGIAFPPNKPSGVTASTSLADASLSNLLAEAQHVNDEVAGMKSLMQAIIAKSNKRMSGASEFSSSSSRPHTPNSVTAPLPVQPQPSYTPLQSAARHMTKVSAQAVTVLSALGQYLTAAEDIDLGARIAFDLVPSILPELKKILDEEDHGKGKERAVTNEHIDLFAKTVQKAAPLLNAFERAKQALYDVSPALLLAIQSISLATSTDGVPDSAHRSEPGIAQPRSNDPLTAFASPAKHLDPLSSIASVLNAIDTETGIVLDRLQALLLLADEQELLPAELRTRAQQLRNEKMDHTRTSIYSFGLPAQRRSRSATAVKSPGIRGLGLAAEEARSETSSMQSDIFYSNSAVANGAAGVDRDRHRDSFPSSLASSRQEFFTSTSLPMSRSVTEPSSTSSSEPSPQHNHSPSRNKLRKFFGDEAPPTSRTRAGAPREDVPPWLEADHEEEMSFNAEGQVKGGTLRALVSRLTSHESSDHAYMTTFLMTYRTFTTSLELFDLLVSRFTLQCPPQLNAAQREIWQQRKQLIIQLRTVNVLKIWIESHLWDDDAELVLHKAADFASRIGGRNAQAILKVVHSRRANGSRRIAASLPMAPPPPSISLRSSKRVKVLDIDPLEMARQLTLMDSRLCARITARECLSKAWPKRLGTETTNITAMTSLGNAITNWVVDTILKQEDIKKRNAIIKHFVLIAERCRGLQNFSTLIHIVAALYTTPVHRLRRTWDTVNQRTMSMLQELNTLMSPTRNFAQYREAIRSVGPPCVPFVGVFLTSWTFIGDGNPDFLRERPEQINLNKRQKAAELIQQIQLHQSTPYNLADVQPIKHFLESALIADYDDQVFYAMSLALEPREKDDDRVARLLTESGFL